MKIIVKRMVPLFLFILTTINAYAKEQPIINIKSENVIQGFAMNSPNDFYTLEQQKIGQVFSPVIYRYIDNKPRIIYQDKDIGHQGFSLEDNTRNGSIIFWTSEKGNPLSALRYELDKNNKLIHKTKIILFPSEYNVKNETIPTISSDNKFLVVRGRTKSRVMFIRVFELSKIKKIIISGKTSEVDVSDKYKYTWLLPTNTLINNDASLRPLQAMASEGTHVLILYGNAKINPKTLFTYTMNGKLINKNTNIDIGKSMAQTDPGGYFYEPEGISFLPSTSRTCSTPYILIVSGKGNNHVNRIFEVKQEH